jgi:hypothetical protein
LIASTRRHSVRPWICSPGCDHGRCRADTLSNAATRIAKFGSGPGKGKGVRRMNPSKLTRVRSWLFIPATRPGRFDKAAASGAESASSIARCVPSPVRAGSDSRATNATPAHRPGWAGLSLQKPQFVVSLLAEVAKTRPRPPILSQFHRCLRQNRKRYIIGILVAG